MIMTMNKKSKIDVGMKFGKLTVVSSSNIKRDKSGRTRNTWVCECDCGRSVISETSQLRSGKTKSCGCSRNKGGKITKEGYRLIYMREFGKYIQEHRLVYEQHHGLKLKPSQNIHHINGDKLDNRIENLELWDTTQPCGQRIEDKIRFYFNLIKGYKDHPLYKDLIDECKNF